MRLADAKMEFIQSWGALGSAWGIPRSMAQIHALLLATHKEMTSEEIMETIQMSRGGVNTNIRELMTWKLVQKVNVLGERKEFFRANHQIWEVAINIMKERKKRELEPVEELINRLKNEKFAGDEVEVAHFKKLLDDLADFINKMDQLSELFFQLNGNVFFQKMLKMLT